MSEDFRERIWKYIGKEWFATEAMDLDGEVLSPLAQDMPRRLVVAILREAIGPIINRSEDPDETVSIKMPDGRDVIEIPARKFKSKEKLLGIRLCKAFSVIDPSYEYNDVKNGEMLRNPNSVLFGDTVVEAGRGNQAMFPSRVLYSSSYSIRKKIDITRKLTHNALSAQGTMWDRGTSRHRQSLFETEYIMPGSIFPSFITLKDPTPEMFLHFMMTLRETSYGAQTSITGSNVRNHVIAILACGVEPPISSYTVSEKVGLNLKNPSSEELYKTLNDHILTEFENYVRQNSGVLVAGNRMEELKSYIVSLKEEELSKIYKKLKEDSSSLWNYSGFGKKEERKTSQATGS